MTQAKARRLFWIAGGLYFCDICDDFINAFDDVWRNADGTNDHILPNGVHHRLRRVERIAELDELLSKRV